MLIPTQALQTAAGVLQRISETAPGERGRRASVVALVLRSIEDGFEDAEAGEFLRLRAEAEVGRLTGGSERGVLRRLLKVAEEGSEGVCDLLNDYAAGLEDARRVEEAEVVVDLARWLAPDRADLALRAARLARLQGSAERALDLYRIASELDGGDGSIARLAAVGEAVMAAEPERALSVAIRRAVRAGDGEAAAVGLEERARIRRSRGARSGAARDLAVAAARYTDPVDRARVGHQTADLFLAAGDLYAAREALLFALASGDATQRAHARARLHTVARDLGDQLGMRRWRSFKPQAIVSLSSRNTVDIGESAAERVGRLREWVESVLARGAR